MSTQPADPGQARMREFMSLLPLTIELAGLPRAEPGKQFNEGQMEVRVSVIRNAFKTAKHLLLEISRGTEG